MPAIRSAASSGSSCSQIRITLQPASERTRSVLRSRSTFDLSFSTHQSRFAFGVVPCSGQQCQKKPSTKTATLTGPKMMSTLLRKLEIGRACTRYRSPFRWSLFLSSISARVFSCLWPFILFRAASLEAAGVTGLLPFVEVVLTSCSSSSRTFELVKQRAEEAGSRCHVSRPLSSPDAPASSSTTQNAPGTGPVGRDQGIFLCVFGMLSHYPTSSLLQGSNMLCVFPLSIPYRATGSIVGLRLLSRNPERFSSTRSEFAGANSQATGHSPVADCRHEPEILCDVDHRHGSCWNR